MRLVATLLLLLAGSAAHAQTSAQAGAQTSTQAGAKTQQAEMQAAWKAASQAATPGPATIPLVDQATLAIPKGMAFIPKAEAYRWSRSLGNTPGDDQIGIVTPLGDEEWIVSVRWVPDGYVRDDEARDMKADDVLASLREGLVESNQDRVARNFPELEITGWVQPPAYDEAMHQLQWALGVQRKGQPEAASTNLNTRALGRNGYFSLNLVTSRDEMARYRPVATTLLAGLDYNDANRYQDFNASTDRIAEYGLLGLIGVVAAKKLGLLALAGVFVLKFAKVGLLALAGLGLTFRKLFRRNPS